jgi:NifB/MoaA-like Fe-S oxidoreductase
LISPIDIRSTAVVIPTYNEGDNIAQIIEALLPRYPAIP